MRQQVPVPDPSDPLAMIAWQWALVRPVWRVLVVGGVVQTAGAVAGVIIKPIGFVFLDFAYGGAVTAFAGCAVGLLWQCVADPGSHRRHWRVMLFLASSAIFLSLMALLTHDIWIMAANEIRLGPE